MDAPVSGYFFPILTLFQPARVEQGLALRSRAARRGIGWLHLAVIAAAMASFYRTADFSLLGLGVGIVLVVVLFVFLAGGATRRGGLLSLIVCTYIAVVVAVIVNLVGLVAENANLFADWRSAQVLCLWILVTAALGAVISAISVLSFRTRGARYSLYIGVAAGVLVALVMAADLLTISRGTLTAQRSDGQTLLIATFDHSTLSFTAGFLGTGKETTLKAYSIVNGVPRLMFSKVVLPDNGASPGATALPGTDLAELSAASLLPPGITLGSNGILQGPGWNLDISKMVQPGDARFALLSPKRLYVQAQDALLVDLTTGKSETVFTSVGESPSAVLVKGSVFAYTEGKILRIGRGPGMVLSTVDVYGGTRWFYGSTGLPAFFVFYGGLCTLMLCYGLYRIPVYLYDSVVQLAYLARNGLSEDFERSPLFFDRVNTLPIPFAERWMRLLGEADPERQSERILELLRRGNHNQMALRLFAAFHESRREYLFGCLNSLLQSAPEMLDSMAAGLPPDSRAGRLFTSFSVLKSRPVTPEELERQSALLEEFSRENYAMSADLAICYATFFKLMGRDQLRVITQVDHDLEAVRQTPDFAWPLLGEVFGQIGEFANDIRNYFVIETFRDKQYYLSEARIKLYELLRKAETLHEPDRSIVAAIAAMWESLITAEAKSIRGPAELEFEFPGRALSAANEWTAVILRLRNAGHSPAENVRVRLVANESLAVRDGEKQIAVLGTAESRDLEFSVRPSAPAAEVRVYVDATFDDFERKDKLRPFADVLRLESGSAEFRPIPNPYIVGTPVQQAQLFFGRKEAIAFAVQNLASDVQNNVLIYYGQRRTGKTSLLYRLMESSLKSRFDFAFIDCQSFGGYETANVLHTIAKAIYRGIRTHDPAMKEPDLRLFKASAFPELDNYLDYAEERLGERKLAVMLDEYEYMEEKVRAGTLHREIFEKLRSIIQHRNKKLAFIFVGTHRLWELSSEYWSFLFNITLYFEIGPLTTEDARDLIIQPLSGYLRYDELAITKILRTSGAHPYFIQLICRPLVNRCNEKRTSYVTLSDVNEVLREAVTSGTGHVEYLFTTYASDSERKALAFLFKATDESKTSASLEEVTRIARQNHFDTTQAELQNSFAGLKQKRLVREDGDLKGEAFGFEIEMLRFWIQEHVTLRDGAIQVG